VSLTSNNFTNLLCFFNGVSFNSFTKPKLNRLIIPQHKVNNTNSNALAQVISYLAPMPHEESGLKLDSPLSTNNLLGPRL
jgi:hypothetical protein